MAWARLRDHPERADEHGKQTLAHAGSLGLLYGAAGLYSAFHPEQASLALTLVLGILLVASGAVRAAWVLAREGRRSRSLSLLLAVVSAALGIAILSQWPLSGLWVIGLFLSADSQLALWPRRPWSVADFEGQPTLRSAKAK